MPTTQVQFRRGTTAQNNSFTGASGEVTVDTSLNNLRIHDGITAGGYAVPALASNGVLSVSGNIITGGYFLGNGACLTGVITSVANINNGQSNVRIDTSSGNIAANVGATGNVLVIATTGLHVTGVVSSTGNITGNYILGNGSQLTGIDATSIQNGNSNVKVVSANGNVTVSVTGVSNVIEMSSNQITFAANLIPSANLTYNLGNATRRWANAFFGANTIYLGDANISSDTSSVTFVLPQLTSIINQNLANTANVTFGNITTPGRLTATGNVVGGNLSAAGNVSSGNISCTGIITATGNIYSTGDVFSSYSDDRLKQRLGEVSNALDKVRAIQSFYYKPNDLALSLGVTNQERQIGVSAQQVANIVPEVVADSAIGADYKTINYDRLVPVLIAAIQELEAKIHELEGVVNGLHKR
jgi:hypothetical protein